MDTYYYQDNGKSYGPFTKKEMISKNLANGTYIWYKGLDSWVPIERMKELRSNHKNRQIKIITIIVLVIIAIIVTCKLLSSINDSKIDNEIRTAAYDDPSVDFNVYVDKFYRDLEVYGIRPTKPQTCIIKFSKVDEIKGATEINGISYGYKNDNIVEIYINPTFWKQASKAQRYWLMYHELSHDLLNLEDLPATPANEGKLMYPYSSSFDIQNMDEFIEAFHELFDTL